jgi:hypothetical protein
VAPRTCPVRAARDWIDFSLITEGPLFRPVNRFGKILPSRLTDQSVALIVTRWALEAGFDPALFAGHSLRSGLAKSIRRDMSCSPSRLRMASGEGRPHGWAALQRHPGQHRFGRRSTSDGWRAATIGVSTRASDEIFR